MPILRKVPRARWLIALSVVLLLCCGGGDFLIIEEYRQCEREVAAVAAKLYADPEPIALELAPLGRVLEVHWVQSIEGGKCDSSSGSVWYDREGIARIDPAEAARLGDRFGWDVEETDREIDPDRRLLPWMPANPDWRTSSALDATFQQRPTLYDAAYYVNVTSGHVYFFSSLHHSAVE